VAVSRRSRYTKTASTCGAFSLMSSITGESLDSLRDAGIRSLGLAVARIVAAAAPIPDLLVPVMKS
jgi:hypothetical protein